jgi:N-glycosylase/DNA lyase
LNATARGLSERRLHRTLQKVGYRFPSTRAAQIARSAECFYAKGNGVLAFLEREGASEEARARVVADVHGLGPKQASLFLRNIGYSDDVAILDTHVLRYMRLIGATAHVTPPSSLRRYTECEWEFRDIATYLGLPVAVADIATWVVMRVIAREAAWRS